MLIVEHVDTTSRLDLVNGQLRSTSEIIETQADPYTGVILRRTQGADSIIISQETQSGDLVVSVEISRPNSQIIDKHQTFIPADSGRVVVDIPSFRTKYVINY